MARNRTMYKVPGTFFLNKKFMGDSQTPMLLGFWIPSVS